MSASPLRPQAPSLRHLTYRPDIDGLRAVAVLAVMGFHAFPDRVKGGFVGVDVFFVISGFLISGILLQSLKRGTFSFRDFYSRRIRRIFPALSVVLLACYAYGWWFLLPSNYEALGKHIASAAGFVSNLTLWRESGYFDHPDAKPLLHLWSLGVEEQFYIVWPLLLWGLWKTRLNLLASCVALMVLSAAVSIRLVHIDAVAAFYSPVARFWELLIGGCLALVATREPRLSEPSPSGFGYHDIQSAIGLACIGAAIVLLKKEDAFPGWWALLPTVGAFLVIWAGPSAWLNRRLLAHPLLVWVGLISYPLYLWHWPLLSFVRLVESTIPPPGTRVAVLLVSVALAWATQAFIERPVRFGVISGRTAVATLCGLMLAIGAAGYVTYRQNGQAFRYPAGVRSLLQYRYDMQSDIHRECWPSGDQEFSPSCVSPPGTLPSVMLWGDSHAGRLYPGLKNVAQHDMAISDFARDGCPPLVDYGAPDCVKSNAYVMDKVRDARPHTVLMFANWTTYAGDRRAAIDGVTERLLATIEQLRTRGVPNIVVMGPAPMWNQDLPALLAQRAVFDAPLFRIPDRMRVGLIPDAPLVDAHLASACDRVPSVRYVSLMKALCSAEGCMTYVPPSPLDLITWDYGHFTTAGAEFVTRYLLAQHVF